MTTPWQHIQQLVYGIVGAIVGLVLLLTHCISSDAGVAIIMGALGISSTSVVANRAINLAASVPPLGYAPVDGRVPVVAGEVISAPPDPVVARAASARPST